MRKIKKGIILFIYLLIISQSGFAQYTIDYTNSTQWTFNRGILVENDIVYTSLHYGLQIWDVTDQNSPVMLSKVYSGFSSTSGEGLAKKGNIIFMAHSYGRVIVIDVTDLNNPNLINEITGVGPPIDVALKEDTLFVLTTGADLYAVDISDLANPIILETINNDGSGTAIAINRNELYASFSYTNSPTTSGIYVTDISDIQNIQVIDTVFTYSYPLDIYIDSANNKLYAAADTAGIKCYDITNPASVAFLGQYSTNRSCKDVVVENDLAYLSVDTDGLFIVNVSNPGSMFLEGQDSYTKHEYKKIAKEGDYIYQLQWGHYDQGVMIKDVSIPSSPQYINRAAAYDFARFVRINNNKIYVSTGHQGTFIHDVSNVDQIDELNQIRKISNWETAITDSFAYVCSYDWGVFVVNISDPLNLIRADSITSINARGIVVDDSCAYIAGWSDGLVIADINNKYNINIVGSFPSDSIGNALTLDVNNNIAYVACRSADGLQILDISDQSNISRLNFYPTSPRRTFDVKVYNSYLFLAIQNEGVRIFDLSNPADPQLVNSISAGSINGFDFYNDLMVIANAQQGIILLDISNINSPQQLVSFNTCSNAYSATLDENYIYVADFSGVTVLEYDLVNKIEQDENYKSITDFKLFQNYPNPFNPNTQIDFYLNRKANVTLVVYDILGRKVKNLISSQLPASNYSYAWDGKDNNGQEVVSGVYYYKVTMDNTSITKKMVLLR